VANPRPFREGLALVCDVVFNRRALPDCYVAPPAVLGARLPIRVLAVGVSVPQPATPEAALAAARNVDDQGLIVRILIGLAAARRLQSGVAGP